MQSCLSNYDLIIISIIVILCLNICKHPWEKKNFLYVYKAVDVDTGHVQTVI